jgi:hypothetical protein
MLYLNQAYNHNNNNISDILLLQFYHFSFLFEILCIFCNVSHIDLFHILWILHDTIATLFKYCMSSKLVLDDLDLILAMDILKHIFLVFYNLFFLNFLISYLLHLFKIFHLKLKVLLNYLNRLFFMILFQSSYFHFFHFYHLLQFLYLINNLKFSNIFYKEVFLCLMANILYHSIQFRMV